MSQQESLGILEVLGSGSGFIRRKVSGYSGSKEDIYVGGKVISKFGLRSGDEIWGLTGRKPKNGKSIPLTRVDLVNGPQVQDQLILPGATNLQLQFGEDINGDGAIDKFSNADTVTDFTKVYAVRLWVMIKTEREEEGLDTGRTYTVAGTSITTPNDGYRRLLISSVVQMRNMVKVDELAAAGSGS